MMKAISVADVGQFVSGIAGALVFIWIIFTYRAQREELALQREEMKAQRTEFEKLASEAHTQSQLLEATAATNRRDAFIRYLEFQERSMAQRAAELLRNSYPGQFRGAQDHPDLQRAWALYEPARLDLERAPSRDFVAEYEGVGPWRGWVWVASRTLWSAIGS